MAAPGVIVMFAVRLVAVLDAAELTVIPLPKLTVDPALKFVPAPVIVTVRLSPGCAELGKALVRRGGSTTVKRLAPVTDDPSVVTVTSRTPSSALGAMVMFAVMLKVPFATTELTVTPCPKLTVEDEVKFVLAPAIVTTSVFPCSPVGGLTDVICWGGASITVNKPDPVTGEPFVVTTTSRTPRVAFGAMVIFAVRLSAVLAVTEFTVMPLPRLTDEPRVKPAFSPMIVSEIV
jgi:hypothetical protein